MSLFVFSLVTTSFHLHLLHCWYSSPLHLPERPFPSLLCLSMQTRVRPRQRVPHPFHDKEKQPFLWFPSPIHLPNLRPPLVAVITRPIEDSAVCLCYRWIRILPSKLLEPPREFLEKLSQFRTQHTLFSILPCAISTLKYPYTSFVVDCHADRD